MNTSNFYFQLSAFHFEHMKNWQVSISIKLPCEYQRLQITSSSLAFIWCRNVVFFFAHQAHHIFTCKHDFVTTISVFMENRTICYRMYQHQTFHLMRWHVATAQLHIISLTEWNYQQWAVLPIQSTVLDECYNEHKDTVLWRFRSEDIWKLDL